MARGSNVTLCSFCGKSHAEVRKLIAGPGVYICDNCINVCKNILDRENSKEQDNPAGVLVPRPADILAPLDQHVIGQPQAKKVLSVAVHNHFKRILHAHQQAARNGRPAQTQIPAPPYPLDVLAVLHVPCGSHAAGNPV